MAAIASIEAGTGEFVATGTVLTADDTITYDASRRQLLVLTNTTAGSLTATLDGDGGSTVAVGGIGSVSVASGLAIVVAAGASKAVLLSTVAHYCQGVVHLTGASGMTAQLINL